MHQIVFWHAIGQFLIYQQCLNPNEMSQCRHPYTSIKHSCCNLVAEVHFVSYADESYVVIIDNTLDEVKR